MNRVIPLPQKAELSAVIPVSQRFEAPAAIHAAYRDALARWGGPFEMIYVIDGQHADYAQALRNAVGSDPRVSIIALGGRFGEAGCLREGVRHARGDKILLLPPYLQVDPAGLPSLIEGLDRADMVTASRDRVGDNPVNRIRGGLFRRTARLLGSRFSDLGCQVRAVKRTVLEEITLHDAQHRFLPLLAEQTGFRVEQQVLPQAITDRQSRFYSPGEYIGGLMDLGAIGFLLKFFQKPFRFFGTLGLSLIAAGLIVGLWITYERFFAGVPMADRPALLLSTLLVVLGIQVVAIGLIAEIIIFTRSDRTRTYRIDKVIEARDDRSAAQG